MAATGIADAGNAQLYEATMDFNRTNESKYAIVDVTVGVIIPDGQNKSDYLVQLVIGDDIMSWNPNQPRLVINCTWGEPIGWARGYEDNDSSGTIYAANTHIGAAGFVEGAKLYLKNGSGELELIQKVSVMGAQIGFMAPWEATTGCRLKFEPVAIKE